MNQLDSNKQLEARMNSKTAEMNNSIHTLASMAGGKQHHNHLSLNHQHHLSHHNQQQQQQQQQQPQQQSVHQQLHHTLQHPLNQPLIGQHQPLNQTVLHFQHQTLQQPLGQHPYSTLHHGSQNGHLTGQSNHQATSNNNTSQTSHHHSNQQPFSQQQQYNMNSDYSSSTYHIYDQISDLIIIKQQRMERKRQLEHRRKVILLSLAAVLLVGTLAFFLSHLLLGPFSSDQQQQRSLAVTTNLSPQLPLPAPPQAAQADWFDAHLKPVRLVPGPQACGAHGTLIAMSNQATMCKCEPGYWGERCELSATYQPPNGSQLARCLLTNCNANGQCNSFGQCQCYPGFYGSQCEHSLTLTSHQTKLAHKSPTLLQQAATAASGSSSLSNVVIVGSVSSELGCPANCNGNGQCLLGSCKCLPGFVGESCNEQQIRHHHHHHDQQQQQQQQQQFQQDGQICFGQTCSNHGICLPSTGQCQCNFGYKGVECEIQIDTINTNATTTATVTTNINENGDIIEQQVSNCSNHGKFDFVKRKCVCDQGFNGINCNEINCETSFNGEQQVDCGLNGEFDCRQNKCVCQDGFTGDRCQIQLCSPQCLRNGQCLDGVCVCQSGFYGRHCSFNGCPNQCSGRGQCIRWSLSESVSSQQQLQQEWKCQCLPGSTGDDCSQSVERQCDDGIDNDLDGLVDCADSECCGDKVCQNSTLCMKSPDPLDILMRKQPPPPTSSFFQRMQFLVEKFSSQTYSNPKDFNDSLMTVTTTATKNVDRASVIRGRVVYMKQGITGVRVSVAGHTHLGFTLTRDGGYFDLMVNGGGAVVIEFRREPFATQKRAVRVPWNEIVLMEPVLLSLNAGTSESTTVNSKSLNDRLPELEAPSCSVHNYKLMRPQIVAAPKSSKRSLSQTRSRVSMSHQQATSKAVLLRNSRLIQQTILLPGSSFLTSPVSSNQQAARELSSNSLNAYQEYSNQSVNLVYISSRANEFMSTINIQLTPQNEQQFKLPAELKLIHLKITIEGNLFEQLFEPQMDLTYTYAWNRRNVYKQKSFGLSTALVSVGYEYFDCSHIVWASKQIQLPGHDLSISDIGSQWNLNIHHRYNYRDLILQRGDGLNFNLKTDKPKVVQTIMGDGYKRQAVCPFCDGATSPAEQRLLSPQSLVSAPDGSIYVADFNLIRRIEAASSGSHGNRMHQSSDRIVRTILELPTGKVPSRYGLAMNPVDQRLYMSHTESYQVFLVKEPSRSSSSDAVLGTGLNETLSSNEDNLVLVAGNGQRCQPEDRLSSCGDGQPARLARLIEPKALAFDLDNRMYIADGPNVRMVDSDGVIYTILGDYSGIRHTKFPCNGEAIPMHKFVPRSPIDLAMSPIDDSLHILDDNVVYKITQDKRVQIVAGRLAHCPPPADLGKTRSPATTNGAHLKATEVFLQSAQSIAFSHNGDLFVSEDDQSKGISRVLLVSPESDSISLYAGLPLESQKTNVGGDQRQQQQLTPTVDSIHLDLTSDLDDKQRSSNVVPVSQTTRAVEYKFSSIAAIAVDPMGNLLVADKIQPRIVSVEVDAPQINAAGEYELQSPDSIDELLIFNRYGHHIATRDVSSGQTQRNTNKYTFTYSVNTSFGQLASVVYASGNKISIYRDGPQHSVKMIETALGGQCKLNISRNGQVQSISTMAPDVSRTNFSYHLDGGLLKQSHDQESDELYEFVYDEFGRATEIKHSSSKLTGALSCRLASATLNNLRPNNHISQACSKLIAVD